MRGAQRFGPASLVLCGALYAQCPDNGQVLVLKQDKGMQLVRFFGKGSYKGFFPGPGFTWVEADKDNPEPTFLIDGLLIQWMFFDRKEFMTGAASDDHAVREAYYQYETDYLKEVRHEQASQLQFERFEFVGNPATDGVKHTFLIWSATTSGKEAKQYWVVTAHPRGAISLSIVPRASTDEPKVKTFIDSYMASYGLLPPREAELCVKALRDFERESQHPQVPAVRRTRSKKPGTSTIPLHPVGN